MDFYVLEDQARKISDFIPSFKPTESMLRAWFEKLKTYHNESLRSAIDTLVVTQGTSPTFPQLLNLVRENNKRFAKGSFYVSLQGGAPHSDQKMELVREYMTELLQIAKGEHIKNPEALDPIKDAYLASFKELPGYVPVEGVRELLERQDFDRLYTLGLVLGGYQPGQGANGFCGIVKEGRYPYCSASAF